MVDPDGFELKRHVWTFAENFCLGPQPRNNQVAFRGLPSCDGFIGMRTLAPWYDVDTLTYRIYIYGIFTYI